MLKEVQPWKPKRAKIRRRRQRYAFAVIIAAVIAIGLYKYALPLFENPSP